MEPAVSIGDRVRDWDGRTGEVIAAVVNDFEETWFNLRYDEPDDEGNVIVKFWQWVEGYKGGEFQKISG